MRQKIIDLIKKNLTDDLLKPEWRQIKHRKLLEGHCYVATEGFYYLYGREHGYEPRQARHNGISHWWLEKEGEILDITDSQFPDGFDYSKGRYQFFMRYPSKRCKILAQRVKRDLTNVRK